MRILLLITLLIQVLNLLGQDSLATKIGALTTYTFDIENEMLIENGAEFLKEEMSNAQFTLLGEFHGSSRISEFTNAIIPILDSAAYNTIVLEVGQFAGKAIDEMAENVEAEINAMYDRFKLIDDEGDVWLPFPFFENEEDLAFLKSYKKHNWKTIGIDQEYYDGLLLLFDMLYNNLSAVQQKKNELIHNEVIDSLKFYYAEDYSHDKSIMVQLNNSPLISEYFSLVNMEAQNVRIINSIRTSAEIYESDWYANYNQRVQHMKNNLRVQLSENDFDLSQDKLLAKMGAYHLSKGFSLWGTYELGNTLNELAAYHGNSSLNIIFMTRYIEENGIVKDLMNSKDARNTRLNELRQYGRQDEWVIIDLRPCRKKYVSQSSDYTFNKYVEEYMKTYDLVIIPKVELDPKPIVD